MWLQTLLIFLLINAPQQAFAEVMDKEPTLIAIWVSALIGSLVCFWSGQYKWWIPIIIFPIAIARPLGCVIATLDPHVGPAIFNEAGWSYVLQAYAATFLVLFSLIAGVIMGRKKISRIKPKPESG
jgi:ABC-type dipeptide/oligopeptide/nickel transport system permease component